MTIIKTIISLLLLVSLISFASLTCKYLKLKSFNNEVLHTLNNNDDWSTIDAIYDRLKKNIHYYSRKQKHHYLVLDPKTFNREKLYFWEDFINVDDEAEMEEITYFNERMKSIRDYYPSENRQIHHLLHGEIYKNFLGFANSRTSIITDCFKKMGTSMFINDIQDSLYHGNKYFDLEYMINGQAPIQKSLNGYEIPTADSIIIETHKVIYNSFHDVIFDSIVCKTNYILNEIACH